MKRMLAVLVAPLVLVGKMASVAASSQANLSEDLDVLMQQAMADHAFPGACVLVGNRRHIIFKKCYGYHTYRGNVPSRLSDRFDIASLTKIVATTSAIMTLYDQHKLSLDDPVVKYLPGFIGPTPDATKLKKTITIRDLLTHVSGLPPDNFVNEVQGINNRKRWQLLLQTPLDQPPHTAMRYSDVGFLLLGKIVEKVSGQSLDQYASKHVFQPLNMQHTQFKPNHKTAGSLVPTLSNLPLGVVHDPIARALGGVAGHAGLFTTIGDLQHYAKTMLRGGNYNGKQVFQKNTVELFAKIDGRVPGSSRALGWDTVYATTGDNRTPVCVNPEQQKPVYAKSRGWRSALARLGYVKARADDRSPQCAPPKQYTAGKYIDPHAFGHTGFTGTSMWISPQQNLYMIVLSNRVYPGVQTGGKRTDRYWRQQIASTVWHDLGFRRSNALYREPHRGWLYTHAKKTRDFWQERVAARSQSEKKGKDGGLHSAGTTAKQSGMTGSGALQKKASGAARPDRKSPKKNRVPAAAKMTKRAKKNSAWRRPVVYRKISRLD